MDGAKFSCKKWFAFIWNWTVFLAQWHNKQLLQIMLLILKKHDFIGTPQRYDINSKVFSYTLINHTFRNCLCNCIYDVLLTSKTEINQIFVTEIKWCHLHKFFSCWHDNANQLFITIHFDNRNNNNKSNKNMLTARQLLIQTKLSKSRLKSASIRLQLNKNFNFKSHSNQMILYFKLKLIVLNSSNSIGLSKLVLIQAKIHIFWAMLHTAIWHHLWMNGQTSEYCLMKNSIWIQVNWIGSLLAFVSYQRLHFHDKF